MSPQPTRLRSLQEATCQALQLCKLPAAPSSRDASRAAGYATSKIYVAADNPTVRSEAIAALGESSLVPPPKYLFTGQEQRGRMTTIRGAVSTAGAVDELLLLSRLDALVIWDLKDSSYSAVAASFQLPTEV